MPDDPTLGEAFRRMQRIEDRLDQRVVSLNTYQAERQADRDQVAQLRAELEKMSASLTWAWRTAVATLLGTITFILTQLVSGGPT